MLVVDDVVADDVVVAGHVGVDAEAVVYPLAVLVDVISLDHVCGRTEAREHDAGPPVLVHDVVGHGVVGSIEDKDAAAAVVMDCVARDRIVSAETAAPHEDAVSRAACGEGFGTPADIVDGAVADGVVLSVVRRLGADDDARVARTVEDAKIVHDDMGGVGQPDRIHRVAHGQVLDRDVVGVKDIHDEAARRGRNAGGG